VIVSACSSTSDNNTGGNTGGDGTQNQTINPELRESVNLSGALSDIFDSTGAQNANQKIAADIQQNHLNDVFVNGQELSQVEDLTVSVTGNFSRSSWDGLTFNGESGNWGSVGEDGNITDSVNIEEANKLIYTSESEQFDISSLDDFKTKLSTGDKLKTALEAAGAGTIDNTTTLAVANNIGFTDDDLLHINVTATPAGDSPTVTNYDLQIPVSNLNIVVPNLTITVAGTNIGEANRTTTNFSFNIGIDDTVSESNESASLATANRNDAKQALVALGLASSSTEGGNTTYTIDNDAVSAVVGVYNCRFDIDSATIAPVGESNDNFTITLQATPLEGYVWDDGSNGSKPVTINATFTAPATGS
ncbi:hypothetical protein D8X55_04910, partial [Malacoplasma penetrans]